MMGERPTLHIMCELPFAGKSTAAVKLSDELGISVVSIDEIKTLSAPRYADRA
jgi:predicted kinase